MSLFIEEPHPFNLPIGINAKYDQDLRDGNYLSNRSSAGVVKLVPGVAKFGFGANSLDISDGAHFLKSTGNVVNKVAAGERIVGVNNTETTYASDNQTVAKKVVNYVPDEANRLYEVE